METRAFDRSIERFNKIDGDKFQSPLREELTPNLCLQWRIRKSDHSLCLIQFYDQGKGYQIYEPEKTN